MIVLKNCIVVEFVPASIHTAMDIVLDGDKIVAVGSNLGSICTAERVIDLKDALVMPGLVCSHHHFYSGLARGLIADIKPCPDFISILKNLWWRLDKAIDEEVLYYSGLVCALDALRSGTTAVIDHHASPSFLKGSLQIIKQVFEEVGLRGITCYETTDRNGGLAEVEAGIEENLKFAEICSLSRHKRDTPYLVEAMIGGHAPLTLSDEALKRLSVALRQSGRGLHLHVAEDIYDIAYSHHVYGQSIISRLNSFDLITDKTLLAHGVHLCPSDIGVINAKGAFMAHNACSNMNNKVGYNHNLPLYEKLVLGTDGIGSNMWQEFKLAYFKHRDAGGQLFPDSFLQYLYNGNLLLERYFDASFGKIAPGYKADLTILDYDPPTPLTSTNLGSHIAFGVDAQSVKTVIVNGRIILEDRQFTFSTKPIYEQARQAAERLWKRM